MSCRAALVVPALLASCGWSSSEEQVLARFFEASRTRDRTILADVATVVFEPRTDGAVRRFDVDDMGPPQVRGFDTRRDAALAVLSLTPPGQPDFDLATVTVEIVARELTVDTDVRTTAGLEERRTLRVTLQRAIGRRGDHASQGRWIVTSFR